MEEIRLAFGYLDRLYNDQYSPNVDSIQEPKIPVDIPKPNPNPAPNAELPPMDECITKQIDHKTLCEYDLDGDGLVTEADFIKLNKEKGYTYAGFIFTFFSF